MNYSRIAVSWIYDSLFHIEAKHISRLELNVILRWGSDYSYTITQRNRDEPVVSHQTVASTAIGVIHSGWWPPDLEVKGEASLIVKNIQSPLGDLATTAKLVGGDNGLIMNSYSMIIASIFVVSKIWQPNFILSQ